MTAFDFAAIIVLLLSILFGFWRGLLYEVLSLLGWPIAFVLSNIYSDVIAGHIPVGQEMLRYTIAYALVFVAVMIVWGIMVWMLSKLVKAIGLGRLDRTLGGVFGVLRGALVILAVVWLAGLTDVPEQPFWRGAKTSRYAEDVALMTKIWLPDNIAHRIHYRAR